jgi:molecular chaperone DnaK
MGQRISVDEDAKNRTLPAGTHALTLNYEALTAEPEPTVTGIVAGLGEESPYYLKIQADSGAFVGSKVNLNKGKFFTSVTLEPHKSNLFWIYVFDRRDNPISVDPDSFTITHGLSIAGAPLPHSIGVAVSKKVLRERLESTDVFERLIEKGAVLPAKKSEKYKTARALKKAQKDNPLWIRVGEGESEIPDRNAFVCELGIQGSDLPCDLPEGTEVELTVEINEIRELSVTAYLPSIDLRLNARSTFIDELVEVEEVERELDTQIDRARSMSASYSEEQKEKITSDFTSASTSLQNARVDEDEKRKAVKQVRDLKQTLDDVQRATEMPQLAKEFAEGLDDVKDLIAEIPDIDDRGKLSTQLFEIKAEGDKAIHSNDKTLLMGINDRLRDLGSKALFSHPATWVRHFDTLITEGTFSNSREAAYLTEQGQQAIERNDLETLKRSCRGLSALLPMKVPRAQKPNASGITR